MHTYTQKGLEPLLVFPQTTEAPSLLVIIMIVVAQLGVFVMYISVQFCAILMLNVTMTTRNGSYREGNVYYAALCFI